METESSPHLYGTGRDVSVVHATFEDMTLRIVSVLGPPQLTLIKREPVRRVLSSWLLLFSHA